ncbi:MAG: DUF2807 domain-containing protein [Kofleriaceae bacterium]
MKTLLTIALILLAGTGCHSLWPDDDLVGDGHLIEVRPSFTAFSGIDIDNSLEAEVTIGEPTVVLTLDQNIIDANVVHVTVENGILVVRQCDGCRDFAPSKGAGLRVSAPLVDRVITRGLASVTAHANGTQLMLESEGLSHLAVTASAARTAEIDASEESTLVLLGAAPSLTIHARDEAVVHSLVAAVAVKISSDELTRVFASASASAQVAASGESVVEVRGEPIDRTVRRVDAARVTFPARE